MELLGDTQYFYGEKVDKYYKITDIENIDDIFSYTIQECELVLYDRTLGLLDEKKKLTKIIELYELVPIGRKKKMTYKLLIKLFDINERKISYAILNIHYGLGLTDIPESIPVALNLTDKYIFKDVIQ